ncbi:DUF2231 domain-containing protein [Xylanimonas protaetiae]|uniref:DUF2231 domain-containing protein n=1 Tax=Xylanimonas protaetiae TaxID=2509457 RepID=A0A4P6F031_9MICO|nr:DUF2231 domain-containing protein [Xylanimonas protaetiae]QAY69090.1 DUF2231 domain-containing protein [Xylanimonas protaetiae]
MTTDAPHSALARTAEGLEQDARLDGLRSWYRRLAGSLPPGRVLDELRGRSLGHPLHPLLTDLPLGLWLSSAVLDLTGAGRHADAAQRLVGAGFVAAIPTALSGLADWGGLRSVESSRVGALHGVMNAAATFTYGASWWLRRRGHHRAGVAVALAGGATVTASGYLGGHLTLRRGEPAASGATV